MQAKPEPAGRSNHFESKMLAFSRNFAGNPLLSSIILFKNKLIWLDSFV